MRGGGCSTRTIAHALQCKPVHLMVSMNVPLSSLFGRAGGVACTYQAHELHRLPRVPRCLLRECGACGFSCTAVHEARRHEARVQQGEGYSAQSRGHFPSTNTQLAQ